jgi:hypothetical protein
MHAEKTSDHNDNNDYADDVENIHDLVPILECATLEITLTPPSGQRRGCVLVPEHNVCCEPQSRPEIALNRSGISLRPFRPKPTGLTDVFHSIL